MKVAGPTYYVLQWEGPASDGGSAITGYKFQGKEASQTDLQWTDLSSTNVLEFELPNLKANTAYNFRVYAVNAEGNSATAATLDTTIQFKNIAPEAPGTPTVTAGVRTNDALTVQWTKPARDGGAPITHYNVHWKKVGETEWNKIMTITNTQKTF